MSGISSRIRFACVKNILMRYNGTSGIMSLILDTRILSFYPFLKKRRIFFIIFTPITTPSKIAIPVLNDLIIASVWEVAGARGAKIRCAVRVIAFFCSRISSSFFVLSRAIYSSVIFWGVACWLFITYSFESLRNRPARKFTIGEMISFLRKMIIVAMSMMLIAAIMPKLTMSPPTSGSRI